MIISTIHKEIELDTNHIKNVMSKLSQIIRVYYDNDI